MVDEEGIQPKHDLLATTMPIPGFKSVGKNDPAFGRECVELARAAPCAVAADNFPP